MNREQEPNESIKKDNASNIKSNNKPNKKKVTLDMKVEIIKGKKTIYKNVNITTKSILHNVNTRNYIDDYNYVQQVSRYNSIFKNLNDKGRKTPHISRPSLPEA
ncbi:hypothetical protein A3Q56_04704 [Intoshia linei]|uniref:Uncharacterized protein n=1 Tax=Intoshia linei TaxID=1819745 RepID=A0A177B1Q9_9BILA|nr:hypothetical protein A3Q56_04704 [Intoshia linei]